MVDIDRIGCQKYPVTWTPNKISMIISPCSEHCKSKCIAAAAYRELKKDDIDNVILIIQSDSQVFHGVALPMHKKDKKPFGDFEVNNSHIEQLSRHQLFHYGQWAHELTLNFNLHIECMQYYLDNSIKITPLLISQITDKNAIEIAQQIGLLSNDRTLIVVGSDIVSSQMYKGYSVFSGISSESQLCDQDARVLRAIQGVPSGDSSLLKDCFADHTAFVVLLKLLQLPQFVDTESYFVGYDYVKGPYNNRMESYASFIFQKHKIGQGYKNYIGSYEQSQLIRIAQNSLNSLFDPVCTKIPFIVSYEMMQPHGVFVSLYAMSNHGVLLRGCMGHMKSDVQLYDIVSNMTEQAARNDSRYYVLTHQEVKSTLISISLVTALHEIISHADLKSSDGIWFQYNDKSVITLPSTIVTPSWNYQDTLSHMCFQASIPMFAWKEPKSKISVFQTITFQEG